MSRYTLTFTSDLLEEDDALRSEVCRWIAQYGGDPDLIPTPATFLFDDDARTLQWVQVQNDAEGCALHDPEDGDMFLRHTVRVLLEAPATHPADRAGRLVRVPA